MLWDVVVQQNAASFELNNLAKGELYSDVM